MLKKSLSSTNRYINIVIGFNLLLMHPTLICPVDIAFYLKNRNIVCNYWLNSFSYRSLFMSAFFFLNDSTMDKSWFPNCSFADATLETKSPTRKKKLQLFTMGIILIIMSLFIIIMSLWALSHFVNCREARQNQSSLICSKGYHGSKIWFWVLVWLPRTMARLCTKLIFNY